MGVTKAQGRKISRRNFLMFGALACGALTLRDSRSSGRTVLEMATFPGIRYYPGLGVHGNGKTWAGDASFVTNYWNEFGAPRETRWFSRSPRYWFSAEKKIE
jgi:hypothetical protein